MSNVINLYNPPDNSSYHYIIQNIEEPTDYQLEKMKKDIKCKINPKIKSDVYSKRHAFFKAIFWSVSYR